MRKMPQGGQVDDDPSPVGAHRLVAPESPARVLLAAACRVLRGEDCADLGQQSVLARLPAAPAAVRRRVAARVATRTGVTADQAGELDAEDVARWVVAHYPDRGRRYPGVVIGSPSGAAVHLSAALGVPWLPAGFEVAVRWPAGRVDDPGGALRFGSAVAAHMLAASPGVAIRQLHDPATRGFSAGRCVSLTVRWRGLPAAYREFFARRLAVGAPVLLLRDARTWPVLDPGRGYSFQVGAVSSGLDPVDFRPGSDVIAQLLRALRGEPGRWHTPVAGGLRGYGEHGVEPGFERALRDWAAHRGHALHRILVPQAEALSAAIADLYRSWLRDAGKTGNRCVVECGRLLDPFQVIRAGLVPYWCENASRRSVTGAEWWLAGSAPFASVDVLPESPGMRSPALAGLPQWLAVASFGRRRRYVDRVAARGYPVTPLPTRHATDALRAQACDLPVPAPLTVAAALAGLRDSPVAQGLLIC